MFPEFFVVQDSPTLLGQTDPRQTPFSTICADGGRAPSFHNRQDRPVPLFSPSTIPTPHQPTPDRCNRLRYPLASTSARTDAAPARRSSRAHASRVAPVVSTSSTSSTWRPRILASPSAFRANARRMFARLPFRPRRVWERPHPGRLSTSSTSRPVRRASSCASTCAWLCPRHARRHQCAGTATKTSTGGSRNRTSHSPCSSHSPKRRLRCSRRPYLKRWISSRTAPRKRCTATAVPNAGRRRKH